MESVPLTHSAPYSCNFSSHLFFILLSIPSHFNPSSLLSLINSYYSLLPSFPLKIIHVPRSLQRVGGVLVHRLSSSSRYLPLFVPLYLTLSLPCHLTSTISIFLLPTSLPSPSFISSSRSFPSLPSSLPCIFLHLF